MADLLLFYPLDAWLAVVAAKVPIGLLAGLPGVGGGIVAVVRPHPGIDLIGGCDRHVRALAIALKLGTGDRPVIYQARDRCSSWRTTLARRPVGDVTLSCLRRPRCLRSLSRPLPRWSVRPPVVLLRRLFALCLAAVAIPCCCALEMALGQERGIVVI